MVGSCLLFEFVHVLCLFAVDHLFSVPFSRIVIAFWLCFPQGKIGPCGWLVDVWCICFRGL